MSEAGVTSAGATVPRILMPSTRRINFHAAWCGLHEFEDVVRSVDDVGLLELEPGAWFAPRQRVARSLAWRGRNAAFTTMNPGVKPAAVTRDYDLFVFVCMNVWDLLFLNAIRDWKSRCRVKVCYMAEFYAGQANEYDHLLRMLGAFDHVILSFAGSVEAVARAIGKPCHHLPFATDVARFTPYPRSPRRVIDVLSIGGRPAPVHEVLLRMVKERDFFYVYDTIATPLIRPFGAGQHRDLLANSAKRSRFFVTYEAKVGDAENQGQSEVGARYFEGAAAGAVLLGHAPTAPSFHTDFPWADPVTEVRTDGSDVEAVLDVLLANPREIERLGARNAIHALKHHDWAHRWRSVLEMVGMDSRPSLVRRLRSLEALAEDALRTGSA